MVVYRITNKINGKQYVGQTIRPLQARWKEHCRWKGRCKALNSAIQKYGTEAFSLLILSECDSVEELNDAEAFWIEYYNSLAPNGYNLREGGGHVGKMSIETRRRMSKAFTGRKHSKETREKMSKNHKARVPWNKGKTGVYSAETLKKMGEAASGRISALRGIPRLEQTKIRISQTLRNRKAG